MLRCLESIMGKIDLLNAVAHRQDNIDVTISEQVSVYLSNYSDEISAVVSDIIEQHKKKCLHVFSYECDKLEYKLDNTRHTINNTKWGQHNEYRYIGR